jgi:queuine/archaeosine tRNA-ribosyltransferase
MVGEALGPRLLTLHNVWFFQCLVRGIRESIGRAEFDGWASGFLSRYQSDAEPAGEESDR